MGQVWVISQNHHHQNCWAALWGPCRRSSSKIWLWSWKWPSEANLSSPVLEGPVWAVRNRNSPEQRQHWGSFAEVCGLNGLHIVILSYEAFPKLRATQSLMVEKKLKEEKHNTPKANQRAHLGLERAGLGLRRPVFPGTHRSFAREIIKSPRRKETA